MGITNITRSLKLSVKTLRKVSRALPKLPARERQDLRSALNTAITDLTLALTLARQYIALHHALLLTFDLSLDFLDPYARLIESSSFSAVLDDFMTNTSGGTGLEWQLNHKRARIMEPREGESWDKEDEGASAKEVLETYRAIGCLGWEDFGVGVHRGVWRVEGICLALLAEVEAVLSELKELEVNGLEPEKELTGEKALSNVKAGRVGKAKTRRGRGVGRGGR